MELLKERIKQSGRVLNNSILKVDGFLNHQVDTKLMKQIGDEFYARFKDVPVTKVLTVESSGIAPSVFTALNFGVDMIFARKRKSLTLNQNLLTAEVFSYTMHQTNTITISRDYLSKTDSVLIIDDFLANGEVLKGLAKLVEEGGAAVAGVGIVIEKSFQKGRAVAERMGYRIESLARIRSLERDAITFLE